MDDEQTLTLYSDIQFTAMFLQVDKLALGIQPGFSKKRIWKCLNKEALVYGFDSWLGLPGKQLDFSFLGWTI